MKKFLFYNKKVEKLFGRHSNLKNLKYYKQKLSKLFVKCNGL